MVTWQSGQYFLLRSWTLSVCSQEERIGRVVEMNEYISDDKVTIMNVTITQSNGADRAKWLAKWSTQILHTYSTRSCHCCFLFRDREWVIIFLLQCKSWPAFPSHHPLNKDDVSLYSWQQDWEYWVLYQYYVSSKWKRYWNVLISERGVAIAENIFQN